MGSKSKISPILEFMCLPPRFFFVFWVDGMQLRKIAKLELQRNQEVKHKKNVSVFAKKCCNKTSIGRNTMKKYNNLNYLLAIKIIFQKKTVK